MPTMDQLYNALRKADAAGDVEGARKLAAHIKGLQVQTAPDIPLTVDPTEGMSTTDKVLAGIGKGFVDTGRGVGQMLGFVSDEEVAAARKLDAPLMGTTAGKVGNFAGNMAVALPTALVPGANTLAGAALIGAGQGFIQPTVGDESRLTNAGIGGLAGAGGIVAGRALKGASQAGKALVEPFSKVGRDKIAGRVLSRFAADADAVARATGGASATRARPTLAEVTGDSGIARLQDSLRAVDPQIGNQILARLSDNNAARVNALQSLAGDSSKRASAVAARGSATAPLYQVATGKQVAISPELEALINRPSVQKAISRAQNIAAEQGRGFDLNNGDVTGQTLQDLKMGMDALLKDPTSGIAGAEANAIKATRDAIVQEMERAIPEFQAARTGYAALSKPLNGMDVGEYIAGKATSNTSDLAGNSRMQANALLGLLRDEPGLLKKATGRNELKSLTQVFEPDQLNLLKAVAKETDRAAAVASAGNGPGSATAQRMASQNILNQLIGPTGLPQSWAESALAQTAIGKPFNLIYGGTAEPMIQRTLADAVLDPETAALLIRQAQREAISGPQNSLTRLLSGGVRLLPSTATVSGER